MKRILLISYNFSPELTGIGKYNGEMINWLAKMGYDCSVLTAYPYYPFWKVQEPYSKKRRLYSYEEKQIEDTGARVRIYRCPLYVPAKPTGFRRIMLDFSFFISAFFRLLTLLFYPKFDFVIAVAPSFQVGLLGVFYKKLRGAKLLYHIQDLQIEAARDLKMIKSDALVNTLLKTEKQILNHADIVSSISDEMVRKVEVKSGKSTFLFPNWTNVRQFFPIANRSALKRNYGFSECDKVILYSGAMGEKQGLEAILSAAESNRQHDHLKFVLCGSGPYKEKLMSICRDRNLTNVHFLPLQPLETFNEFLNMADIHLIIQKTGASDLVMPSKLGAILAVGGVALVTANEGTSLHTLIRKHNMGFVVDTEDQKALENGILRLLAEDDPDLGRNARKYAVDFLAIDQVMARFERAVRQLWSDKRILNGANKKYKKVPPPVATPQSL